MTGATGTGPRRPRLSVGLRNFAARPPGEWRFLLDQVRAAEAAGVDAVFVSDHLLFGADLAAYGDPDKGGREGGRQPTGPDGEWLEALSVLTAFAAVTDRLRLGTNVLVAPLRPAPLLAKVATTIDRLSGGRLELGVGIGWQRAEYEALGLDYERRGERLDELLDACRVLWTEPVASYNGEHVRFDGVHMMPKPTRPGGVPVWIGGGLRRFTARRLARHGAGWIPWGVAPDGYGAAAARMRELIAEEGGDPDGIEMSAALPHAFTPDGDVDHGALFAPVATLVEHGVTDFRTMLRVPAAPEEALDMLGRLVAAFDDVSGRRSSAGTHGPGGAPGTERSHGS